MNDVEGRASWGAVRGAVHLGVGGDSSRNSSRNGSVSWSDTDWSDGLRAGC